MKKWQYLTSIKTNSVHHYRPQLHYDFKKTEEDNCEFMNRLGKEGWELVSVVPFSHPDLEDNTHTVKEFYKREIED